MTTDHKEEEQLEDRGNVGEKSFNSGDGTDQRVQSLMLVVVMMMMMMMRMTTSAVPAPNSGRGNPNNLVDIVIRLAGWQRNYCSIPGRGI